MGLKAVLRHKLSKDDRLEKDDKTDEEKNKYENEDQNKNLEYREFDDGFSYLIYNEINLYNKLCKYEQALNTNAKELFKKFPTCIMRSILHYYDCKYDTWIKSQDLLHFSESCSLYDLENMKDVNKYVDCFGVTRRFDPDKKELINYFFGQNITIVGNKFVKLIDELCLKEPVNKKALCAAYELRDECENDKPCIENFIKNKLNRKCPNKSFKRKSRQIKDIFDLNNENEGVKYETLEPLYFDPFDILNLTVPKEIVNTERKLIENKWETKTFFTRNLKSADNKLHLQVSESQDYIKLNGIVFERLLIGIIIFGLIGIVKVYKPKITGMKTLFLTISFPILMLFLILYII